MHTFLFGVKNCVYKVCNPAILTLTISQKKSWV